MHQQYHNAPLFEVSCEIRFSTSEDWDVFFFSNFYNQIRERFPHKTTRQEYVLPTGRLIVGDDVEIASPILEKKTSLECKNEDKNVRILLRENSLGIAVVPPYKGWTVFKEDLSYVLEAYKYVVNPLLIDKIALKYRNKIDVGSRHSYESMLAAFDTRPYLDKLYESNYKGRLSAVQMVLEFRSEDNKNVLSLQQHTLQPDEQHDAPVLFDLAYHSIESTELIKETAFEQWLEDANKALHEGFENSLTTAIKQTFN